GAFGLSGFAFDFGTLSGTGSRLFVVLAGGLDLRQKLVVEDGPEVAVDRNHKGEAVQIRLAFLPALFDLPALFSFGFALCFGLCHKAGVLGGESLALGFGFDALALGFGFFFAPAGFAEFVDFPCGGEKILVFGIGGLPE